MVFYRGHLKMSSLGLAPSLVALFCSGEWEQGVGRGLQ